MTKLWSHCDQPLVTKTDSATSWQKSNKSHQNLSKYFCLISGNFWRLKAAGSDEEFLNDRGGVEFGEGRDVETVIVEKELENVVALLTGEAEEVHGGVVHAHELQQIGCLLSLHIVGM